VPHPRFLCVLGAESRSTILVMRVLISILRDGLT
jgi:hypothetical protein